MYLKHFTTIPNFNIGLLGINKRALHEIVYILIYIVFVVLKRTVILIWIQSGIILFLIHVAGKL